MNLIKFDPNRISEATSEDFKVLIVEDDLEFAEVIYINISTAVENAKCFFASNLEEAKFFLDKIRFDCVILDLKLNHESGEDLLPVIAASESNKCAPIIVSSAFADDQIEGNKRILKVLKKPYEFADLVGAVSGVSG